MIQLVLSWTLGHWHHDKPCEQMHPSFSGPGFLRSKKICRCRNDPALLPVLPTARSHSPDAVRSRFPSATVRANKSESEVGAVSAKVVAPGEDDGRCSDQTLILIQVH